MGTRFKDLELPKFLLHYEIQVECMPKTSDGDEYMVTIIQHHEGVSKRLQKIISTGGMTDMMKYALTNPYIKFLEEFLYNKVPEVFQEAMKEFSEKWAKLDNLKRLPY